jgi:hypothetical protein
MRRGWERFVNWLKGRFVERHQGALPPVDLPDDMPLVPNHLDPTATYREMEAIVQQDRQTRQALLLTKRIQANAGVRRDLEQHGPYP